MDADLPSHGDLVFGLVGSPPPLVGFPPGRTRIRMRPHDLARVYVRDAERGSTRVYLARWRRPPGQDYFSWMPGPLMAVNESVVDV